MTTRVNDDPSGPGAVEGTRGPPGSVLAYGLINLPLALLSILGGRAESSRAAAVLIPSGSEAVEPGRRAAEDTSRKVSARISSARRQAQLRSGQRVALSASIAAHASARATEAEEVRDVGA